ncbi:2OG-Fe(II) oxygenase [Dyella terrae]|nr:2OG-Fe(II) oxygenase [Dyella terrae]
MLLAGSLWPLPCDCYLLRFPAGTTVPPHVDRVERGRHFRLNIILRPAKRGGEFVCERPIFISRRIKLFRPDRETHSVTRIEEGTRWVLSFGWVRGAKGAVKPAA